MDLRSPKKSSSNKLRLIANMRGVKIKETSKKIISEI